MGNYQQLRSDRDKKLDRVYQQTDRVLAQYNKFILQPIVLYIAPNSEGGAIDPAKLQELMTYFDTYLQNTLGAKYEIVNTPGPGVAQLRVALTDVKLGNTVMSVIPVSRVAGAGLGGASFEAEMFDSVSRVRIAAVVDSSSGKRFGSVGLDPLDNAKYVFRFWIDDLVRRIDRAQLSR
ncbi:MAG: DUF3313 domain-containing protein [Planctomycetota bacterium]|nr:DUF3313 domain-containing protein [Planctomycetota bacterium]